jgi:hypothetical protein
MRLEVFTSRSFRLNSSWIRIRNIKVSYCNSLSNVVEIFSTSFRPSHSEARWQVQVSGKTTML